MIDLSSSDDKAVAARVGSDQLFFARRTARVLIAVTAAGSAAVELDSIAFAGDAPSLTCAGLGIGAVVAEGASRAGRAAV